MLSICSFGCDCDHDHVHRRLCLRTQISSRRKRVWPQRFSGHPRNSARVHCDGGAARGGDGNGVSELPGFRGKFSDRLSAPYLPHDRKNRFPRGSLRSFTRPSSSCWIPSVRLTDSRANRLSSRVWKKSRRRTRTAVTHPRPDTARDELVARHSMEEPIPRVLVFLSMKYQTNIVTVNPWEPTVYLFEVLQSDTPTHATRYAYPIDK